MLTDLLHSLLNNSVSFFFFPPKMQASCTFIFWTQVQNLTFLLIKTIPN